MAHITEAEKDELLALVDKVNEWIADQQKTQAATSAFEDPAFDSSEVAIQLRPVGALFDKLMKKPRPVPPKKVNVTASSNETSAGSNTTSEGDTESIKVNIETNGDQSAPSSTSGVDKDESATVKETASTSDDIKGGL
jgi:hypothetical protein